MQDERSGAAQALQAEVDGFSWHHEIDFGGGVRSKGNTKNEILQRQADVYFLGDCIKGKTFLDIGCWDGFNSFEAYRRSASRVLATDHFAWSEKCWGQRGAFELARKHIAPSVEVLEIDIPDLNQDRIGTFDVVLFAGVFYHLRHPFAVLEQISLLARDWLIVETHIDGEDIDRPAMVFYPGSELANDPTNWWGPNKLAVEAMLRDVGFANVETYAHPCYPNRAIFRARRGIDRH